MKAIEQYFHVVLFIMLYKVVLTFKSVNETLVCDHSNESYWAVHLNSGCDHLSSATNFPIYQKFPSQITIFETSCKWQPLVGDRDHF